MRFARGLILTDDSPNLPKYRRTVHNLACITYCDGIRRRRRRRARERTRYVHRGHAASTTFLPHDMHVLLCVRRYRETNKQRDAHSVFLRGRVRCSCQFIGKWNASRVPVSPCAPRRDWKRMNQIFERRLALTHSNLLGGFVTGRNYNVICIQLFGSYSVCAVCARTNK